MDPNLRQKRLVRILQGAFSGELAAAYAYRGHWKSVKDPTEREQIQKIENDEWLHRQKVQEFLRGLKARPSRLKEIVLWCIGRSLGLLCFCAGWFFPMFFAGRLETQNVGEYAEAAGHARALQFLEMEAELSHMAKVEKEHEEFFYKTIQKHRLFPFVKRLFRVPQDYR